MYHMPWTEMMAPGVFSSMVLVTKNMTVATILPRMPALGQM